MLRVRVIACSDCSFWYARHIGGIFAVLYCDRDEWVVRTPDGTTNIIKTCDAEMVT